MFLLDHRTVGKPNGFRMLDFVFGNDESALDAFGEVVAAKYTSILARMMVAGESWTVERRWDQGTPKSRVIVNEETTNVKDFLHMLLPGWRFLSCITLKATPTASGHGRNSAGVACIATCIDDSTYGATLQTSSQKANNMPV